MFPSASLITIVTALFCLAPAWPQAAAQQEYTLGDDDTWIESEALDPATPEGQLAAARAALAANRYERADHLATRWIDRNEQHPLLAEAYIIRGDSLMARKEYYKALFEYEYVARVFTGSEPFVTALERELEIAKLFASGTKRKLWGMRIVSAREEAEELLIRVQERLPGSRLAEDAGITLADYYFARRQMSLAADMYDIFIENFPRSEHLDKARRRLIYAHLASFKGPEFDPAGLYEARVRLRELKAVAPASAQKVGADALLSRIDESDALKLLTTSRWYVKTGDPIAAELTIRRLVSKYPRSVAAADAMRLIPDLLTQLPAATLEDAPDYTTLSAAILGTPAAHGEAAPAPPISNLLSPELDQLDEPAPDSSPPPQADETNASSAQEVSP